MRVGRVSSIKFMPYRDVRMLLRYFSLRGVKLQSKNTDFSKIDRLQPSDSKNAKQKEISQKTLNNITLDTFEEKQMQEISRMDLQLKDKAQIDLIKLMTKAREGSKFNTMRYTNSNALFDIKSEKRDDEKSLQQEQTKDFEKQSEKQENISKYEHKDTKSLVEEYAEFLKEIDKKSQKEESKKESEKKEKQSEEF